MIDNSLNKLTEWLETWRMKNGAYNGFVIHRFNQKRMFYIHDTAWSQAAIIRGYANLYARENKPIWQQRMQHAADLQVSRLDLGTGKYKYAGHEDDRFCSLVHCGLANCALLRAADHVNFARKEKYFNAVRCNIDVYWERLWVASEGAYKFSDIDFYSPHEDRFVINFNMIATENLILLWERTKEQKYKARALKLGEWLIQNLKHARDFHAKLLSDKITVEQDPLSEWMALGGLPYQFTPSKKDPDNCVLIYAALALRGICALYRITQDDRYAQILFETVEFILNMRDPETHFFYHTTCQGKIEHRPQFIAGIGMMLVGIYEARELLGTDWDWSETLQALLIKQYANGSFPSFLGKDRKHKTEAVWEDVVATVNWNAQVFEYLTLEVERKGESLKNQIHHNSPFIYTDTPNTVLIISLYPKEFMGVLFCIKKFPYSLVSFFPYDFYVSSAVSKTIAKVIKAFKKRIKHE